MITLAHKWTLANIYGPCSSDARTDFTNWLYDLGIPSNQDWRLLEEFNYIRAPDNRNKPGANVHDMFTFNDFIREQNLTELPIKGRAYTWSNMQLQPLLKQLDWIFTMLNWTTTFPNTLVNPLGKPVSDHSLFYGHPNFNPKKQTLQVRNILAFSSWVYGGC